MSEKKVFEGFNRVVINYEGDAVSMNRAFEMGFEPEVGFMRKDGWSLGAPKELAQTAYNLWAGEWTHTIKKPETEWTSIGFKDE